MTDNTGWLPPEGRTLTWAELEALAIYTANRAESSLTFEVTS